MLAIYCLIVVNCQIHQKPVKAIIKDIKAQKQFDPCGGRGKSDWLLNSLHMISYDLPIHSKALKAIIKEK